MATVSWIDVVSPKLRRCLGLWIEARGPRLIPATKSHESFLSNALYFVDPGMMASVVFPPDGSGILFDHVGQDLATVLPGIRSGSRLDRRQLMTQPIRRRTGV